MSGSRWALLALTALVEAADASETAQFLRLQPSPRAMAMGDSIGAAAAGTDALASNPAGLARKGKRQAAFSRAELFEGTALDRLAYAQGLGEREGWGASALRLSHPELEGRDAARNATGGFEASDMALGGGYARKYGGALVGAALSYVQSSIAGESARTVALDAGAIWDASPEEGLTLSAGARSLGPGMKLGGEKEALPTVLSLGAAHRFHEKALFTAELKHRPYASISNVALGAEVHAGDPLALRVGWSGHSMQGREGRAGGASGLSAGMGLTVANLTFDYAFSPYGELQDAHRVGLSIQF